MKEAIREELTRRVKTINAIAARKSKKTAFLIGNTAKNEREEVYLTPVRETESLILTGAITYNEIIAKETALTVDGTVDIVLLDAEKKIGSACDSGRNIEAAVRPVIQHSRIWPYKANDLTVDAADHFISFLLGPFTRESGHVVIGIIGLGNIGAKLCLRLMERGAELRVTRRSQDKLKVVCEALNIIKPKHTPTRVTAFTSNTETVEGADLVITATDGVTVVDRSLVACIPRGAKIVDIGKGSISIDAYGLIDSRGIELYRLDISAALEGIIRTLEATDRLVSARIGKRRFEGETVVSGGFFARENEFVVDDYNTPSMVYGISNGRGDFCRTPDDGQLRRLQKLERKLRIRNHRDE